ncbi:hypothetical protein [Halospeciosus flavus]|uniref:hypothetical protein n=1 Tax=Halospeciosus flavus TaxID=3032283 RepID=UPI00361E3382
MKTYVLVPDSAFTGYYRDYDELGTGPSLEFESETRVFLGVRSPHDRPQATITVPDDPSAIATAVSALGSALKEYSCERSWPTLRGHPPAIERGGELHVPDVLEKPDTGVTIALPPTYADVYRVAPLAYYLGADVVTAAGIDPELRLDVGHTEPLRRPGRTLEASVDRLLARCLLLDSLVRIDGYYSFTRYEYDEVAPHLPFYPPELYGESLDAQLMEYLEVPFDVLEPYVPQWPTTAVLRPDPGDVEVVPSLLDPLSRIHVAPADESAGASATGPEHDSNLDSRLFDPTVTAYAGRTPPVGETRLVPAAFENARHQKRNTPSECHLQCFGVDAAAVDAFERIRDTVVASPQTRRRHSRPRDSRHGRVSDGHSPATPTSSTSGVA